MLQQYSDCLYSGLDYSYFENFSDYSTVCVDNFNSPFTQSNTNGIETAVSTANCLWNEILSNEQNLVRDIACSTTSSKTRVYAGSYNNTQMDSSNYHLATSALLQNFPEHYGSLDSGVVATAEQESVSRKFSQRRQSIRRKSALKKTSLSKEPQSVLERRRSKKLSEALQALKLSIPYEMRRYCRDTKIAVLKLATQYISTLSSLVNYPDSKFSLPAPQ